ncbi:hypothetical protein [Streptomyces sp. ST2-7A]|uniref:hypothetical protein n=1 Tax=Streptomyces sp. ST2-7A TaxID=2907214 RepID=UPI001F3354A1|nr:hypothetical protein [Streptomyces sp. ST2-7A]MCE7080383.1 hypothetical protein [Streptomyces sp. ST2-7A]
MPLAGDTRGTTWTDEGESARGIEVTPSILTRGKESDLENISLRDHQEGLVPHYLTFEVTATDGAVTDPAVEEGFAVVGTDGRAAEPLSLMTFGGGSSPYPAACDRQAPDRIDEGETVTICQMFLMYPGGEPLRVAYTDPGDEPLLWPVDGAEPMETLRAPGSEVETAWSKHSGENVPLLASLVEVAEGTARDLHEWDVETEGKTPFHVTMEYRNDGEHDLLPSMRDGIEVWTATGASSKPLLLLDVHGRGVEPCPDAVPNEMLRPGGTVRECTIHLLDDGEVPATVYLHPTGEVEGPRAWLTGLEP